MRVLILGGDGYLGWPTAMHFAARGHEVTVIDNYLRRTIALETDSEPLYRTPTLQERAEIFAAVSNHKVRVVIGDCCDYDTLRGLVRDTQPEVVVHYAEQPSAPYSMRDYGSARLTLDNNLKATFNLAWAVIEEAPQAHIIKLGTMGEYGTPKIDIEEGWIEIDHKGRKDTFLFPRQAGSLYHTTKVLDTDLLWFYVRTFGIQVTDLMQGPVYGLRTPESELDDRLLPNFHYDDIFGTVVNRFLAQAVAGIPLTVYGKGGQTRGYLNLLDTLQCVELAAANPPGTGQLRILNQFTETFSVNALAEKVINVGRHMGLNVEVQALDNPRKEAEEHYYNPTHSGLLELGLQPNYLTDAVMEDLLKTVMCYKDAIAPRKVLPRVRWKQ
ncbi:NAD-dependent epimerase/dehydratase family protein [Algihabitans albus]|uniref:NAD-dependent epimerase/dehydratase family protein n=1 Tax=Algihabitans albus TaxID=2164067 RepID=UPI000E5CC0CD|nr:NAD-dependent epimerase/dehydratase family protein [Algihabitans albus]